MLHGFLYGMAPASARRSSLAKGVVFENVVKNITKTSYMNAFYKPCSHQQTLQRTPQY